MTAPERLERFQNYIGGAFVDAPDGRTFGSLDPYAGEPWATVPEGAAEDVDHAVAAARAALDGEWGAMTGFQRAALMRRLADLIGENAERLARVEVRDNGKLYREMIGQLQGLGAWYHYFAGHADKIEGRVIPTDKPQFFLYTRREPVGVVGAITPWNSPLLLMTWKLAPALAAGCTFVVKPSEHSPASTLAFAQAAARGRLPGRGVQRRRGSGREIGAALAGHPGVDKIAFTGSTATGRAVAHAAAENLNRVTLELGGKSPQVVFEDADLEAAANGSSPASSPPPGRPAWRVRGSIVHESVHDELVRLVAERANAIKLGDPNDPETEMGPVANRAAVREGARLPRQGQGRGRRRGLGGGADDELGGCSSDPTRVHRCHARIPPWSARRCSARCRRTDLPRPRRRRSSSPTTPRTAWPARCGRKDVHRAHRVAAEAAGRHGLDQRLPGGRPRRAVRRVRATAGWAGRTASTRCTSTPRSSPSGWS